MAQPAEETKEAQINLEEARLQIGDPVQLQSLNDENPARYAVRLLGFAKGRSVIVSAPTVDGKYLLMRDGQAFVLRAFSGKNAYAFPTQLIKSINAPYPYLHLAYPKDVRSLVVRRGARASVRAICAVTERDGSPTQGAGTLLNLSIGGALMAAKQPLGEKGQRLTIKFKTEINAVEAYLVLYALIRAINIDESDEPDKTVKHGLEFIDIPGPDMILLSAYVYHHLLEQSLG
jgi:c-di-GMP-binding flagellar brake protein YcgR